MDVECISELGLTSARSADALADELTQELRTADSVSGASIARGARTLARLVAVAVDECSADESLMKKLEQLMDALAVRVGELIDAGGVDDAYELGTALELVGRQRRRCLGGRAGRSRR